RGGASGGSRAAATGRAAGSDQLPFARGSDREAVPPGPGAWLHVPARLPGLRLRAEASPACDLAPRDSPFGTGGRREPAGRLREAARSSQGAGGLGRRGLLERRRTRSSVCATAAAAEARAEAPAPRAP